MNKCTAKTTIVFTQMKGGKLGYSKSVQDDMECICI